MQLLLWKLDGELFCSSVNSTAFQYPLLDADIVEPVPAGAKGPVVRSKLDGTTYQLRDGKVLEWCPKEDSPLSLRNFFAGLKTNAPPVPLPATLAPARCCRSAAPFARPSSTPSTAARASDGVVTASPALGCCCASPAEGTSSASATASIATTRARRGATPTLPRPPSGRTSAG